MMIEVKGCLLALALIGPACLAAFSTAKVVGGWI